MTTSGNTPGGEANHNYTPEVAASVEAKWQKHWDEAGTFSAPNPVGDLAPAKGADLPENKLFVQDMFPYPSGAGLHVGHPLGYIATDVFARFHRMQGKNVLHTLGYDAFGLPAEQYAVQTGTHPRITTEANIENMGRQLGRLGLGHDKRRAFATTDPEYYKWTQWIFLQIFNSWFDERENKAKPISSLIDAYSDGSVTLPEEFAGRSWSDLDGVERERALEARRLVYRSNSMVNWCPGLGTVLSNEEVTADGRSERGNFPVFRKRLGQWMMRITEYSDRLADDLELLDWPEKVKTMQRNWIGRSRGAEVTFAGQGPDGTEHPIEVFTTRPDTLFGATYMVLAPEIELVDQLIAEEWPADIPQKWTGGAATPREAVEAYRFTTSQKSELERQEDKEKTGVFTGSYAVNPVNGHLVPVFIADYVLAGYGTGAIMAVPGHDTRDHEFATAFQLPIVAVVGDTAAGYTGDIEAEPFTGDGVAVNSQNDDDLLLDGLPVDEAKATVIEWLEKRGLGKGTTQYKLRDWLFARQRYWGEPFPVVYDENDVAHPLPESMLPVELPEVEDYKPVTFDPDDADTEPQAPLSKATDWVNVELDLGDGTKKYRRDTNVMPNWAGSSWYQLRYIDPTNADEFCDLENERYWTGPKPDIHGENDPGGVDLYVGGVEHAVLHLLYSRFWHKVLFDLGHVTSIEPYRRLFNQGYIQAFAYTDARGVYVQAEDVVERDGKFYLGEEEVFQEYGKMGKSLKNSVSPDEVCDSYGADTLRVYEMSMGPLDTSRPWATKDLVGSQRFLQRTWRLVVDQATGELGVSEASLDDADLKSLHRTIAGVTDDYANLRDNTAIAKLIEYVNYLTKRYGSSQAPRAAVEPLILMLGPVAPHIAEELWSRLGHENVLAAGPWPELEEKWLVDDSVEYPVQVNGKVRARIEVAADADKALIESTALADERVVAHTSEGTVAKVIVVPGKMVNIVVKK